VYEGIVLYFDGQAIEHSCLPWLCFTILYQLESCLPLIQNMIFLNHCNYFFRSMLITHYLNEHGFPLWFSWQLILFDLLLFYICEWNNESRGCLFLKQQYRGWWYSQDLLSFLKVYWLYTVYFIEVWLWLDQYCLLNHTLICTWNQPVLRATRVKLLKKTAGALMGLKFTLTDDESDALPIMQHTRVVLDSCLTDN